VEKHGKRHKKIIKIEFLQDRSRAASQPTNGLPSGR